MLEGQGRDRHGARRDHQQERQAAHALAERLGLAAGEELEPWCWRVAEGDAALDLVATLGQLGDEVEVEWVDDARLLSLGSVGRARHAPQGGRPPRLVRGGGRGRGEAAQVVPLAVLLAAIREERRYVRGGPARVRAHRGDPAPGAGQRRGRAVRAPGHDAAAAGGQRSADGPGRGRGADRGQRRRSRPCAGASRRGPAPSPRLPAALEAAAAPVPEGGRHLDGAPGALGSGRDPRRRDGPGQDHPDAGPAAAPVGQRPGAGGGPHLGGDELGERGGPLRPRAEGAPVPRPRPGGAAGRPGARRPAGHQLRHRHPGRRGAEAASASDRWCWTRPRR